MTVMGKNAPPLDGWSVQPGRHCGQICIDVSCDVCGVYVLAAGIVLADN